MDKDSIIKIVICVVWPLIMCWNGYLHNCVTANAKAIQNIQIDVAKNYISSDEMDKYFVQLNKRLDRLEAKLDAK